MQRTVLGLIATVALFTSCGGAPSANGSDVSGDSSGKSDNPGSVDPATAFKQLKDVLTTNGVFLMPPYGVTYGATDLTPSVQLVDLKTTTSALVGDIVSAIAKDEAGMNDTGATTFDIASLADVTNAKTLFETEWIDPNNHTIRDYLVNKLVVKSQRSKVSNLISNLGAAFFVHFSMNDTGAELIGNDIILIQPYSSKQVLVIRLDYVAG